MFLNRERPESYELKYQCTRCKNLQDNETYCEDCNSEDVYTNELYITQEDYDILIDKKERKIIFYLCITLFILLVLFSLPKESRKKSYAYTHNYGYKYKINRYQTNNYKEEKGCITFNFKNEPFERKLCNGYEIITYTQKDKQ